MTKFLHGNRSKVPFVHGDPGLDAYLERIGETPLISPEEEVRLSRKIQAGNKKALDALVNANLRFVVSVAKQYQNQGLTLGDLINEGNIGLIKAASRFDGSRGFKFISYAVWWVRQSILQALAEQSRIVRLPLNRVGELSKVKKTSSQLEQAFGREPTDEEIAAAADLTVNDVKQALRIHSTHTSLDAPFDVEDGNTLIDVFQDRHQASPEEELVREELVAIVQEILDTLTKREAEVINMYFGLNCEKALTLEEIGAQFQLTRERVRQIKEKALRRLRHSSRSNALRPYLFNNEPST